MSGCTSIINLRYQEGEEGSRSNPANFNNQDYAQLRDNSRRRRRLFVDTAFPPNNQSLGDLSALPKWREDQVVWKRPADIMKDLNISGEPVFLNKGASRFDFTQGYVGNCWFLAAISALTFHKGLLKQVVPFEQSFSDYAGIFHFRFWRFGKWVDVVIDDFLPTLDNQLLSVNTKSGNEFWGPLMEKAYAKVCGTYADMSAGLPSEACKDFSGGVAMMYQLREEHSAGHDEKLWLQLSRATGCDSMICCGTAQKGDKLVNTVAHTGLVDAHAYSVTGVTEVTYYGSKVKLVRVMNPWGRTEWNGKWSDKSDMWQRVSPEDRAKCEDRDNGEFWMELEDFCRYFLMLFICCENPNFIDGDLSCQWKCMTYDGSWVPGRTAGGNVNESSFATNPQYRIKVTEINKSEQKDMNVMLSLMQKPKEDNRKERSSIPVALTIFKVPEGTRAGRLDSNFFRRNRPLKASQNYSYQRDLVEQHSMELGEYVIVPSTMRAYTPGEFTLSVFTKTDAEITPHEDEDDDHDHDHDHDHDNDSDNDSDGKDDSLILPEVPDKDKDESTDSVRSLFKRYANQSAELSYIQLQKLLNDNFPHGTWNGFGRDTCLSMMAIVDTDQKMTMTISEFSVLWKKMNEFKKIFHSADTSGNGSLSDRELQNAIKARGMDVNDGLVRMMMFRYSGYSSTSMEAFITLMLRLDKVKEVFDNSSSGGVISMTWTDLSSNFMYN